MIVVDANVLLNAVNDDSRSHRAAADWLESALFGRETLGIPWVCALAFVRISTNPRVTRKALRPHESLDIIESWFSQASVVIPEPTARHAAILRGLLESVGTAGNLTTDAHIAALALEYGASVATYDRDFERFGVKIVIPGA